MAHFAELDENNVVLRIVVIDNKDNEDEYHIESEEVGARFLRKTLGGRWVQTSYNHKIRKFFACIGGVYIPEQDIFMHPKPAEYFVFDPATEDWIPPIPAPDEINHYIWDFENHGWVLAPCAMPVIVIG